MATIILRGEGKIVDKINGSLYINLGVARDISNILAYAQNGLKELIIETSGIKPMQLDVISRLIQLADLVTIKGKNARIIYQYATEAKKVVFQSPIDCDLVVDHILSAFNIQTRTINATIVIDEGSKPEAIKYLLDHVFNTNHSVSVQAHWSYTEVIFNSGYGEKIEIICD